MHDIFSMCIGLPHGFLTFGGYIANDSNVQWTPYIGSRYYGIEVGIPSATCHCIPMSLGA